MVDRDAATLPSRFPMGLEGRSLAMRSFVRRLNRPSLRAWRASLMDEYGTFVYSYTCAAMYPYTSIRIAGELMEGALRSR
jgi:hypothetical protein